ncbi:DNA-binding protein [Bordetella genomosp. 9]|uniref:DNA-binding protein n=1 Tax=Bordetella genomosp. 9 TaxID=1416803 RepID=A0A261R6Q8_9BORD|nr:OB-fold domain-containing protein [Bordetella genomosp. 9]OZI20457.1 DNA-binding protein [Bordetella genomosp. 9]
MAIDTKARDSNAPTGPLGPEQTYFRFLQEGDWRIQRCRGCGKAVFYPRIACPGCDGQDFDWVAPSGNGTVYSTTVMRRPAQAGGDRNLCLVDLDEGVRMMSRIEDVDPAAPRIGDRVRARLRREGEQNLVVFTLLEQTR